MIYALIIDNMIISFTASNMFVDLGEKKQQKYFFCQKDKCVCDYRFNF